jgi:hypothetical protein
VSSFGQTAPTILTDSTEADRLVRQLDRTVDLMELAASSAALAALALDVYVEREGKDNHAQAMLETANWLRSRLMQGVELWKTVED